LGILGKIKDSIEDRQERKREEQDKQEEYEDKVDDLLDKFEIPDFDDFLMNYLNKKPEPRYEEDKDTGRDRKINPGRKEYLDFTWEHLEKDEINYNHIKDFALKNQIVSPSFFGEKSADGAGFWKNAYAHQRGKLLRAVKVPDDQIKILADKKYPELPAPLRYEIETNGKSFDLK